MVLGRPDESPSTNVQQMSIITPAALRTVPAAVAFSDLAPLIFVNAGAAKTLAIAAVSILALTAPLPVAPAVVSHGMRISRAC